MWTYERYSNELYHHGVKGMRWGHRKAIIKSSFNNFRSRFNFKSKPKPSNNPNNNNEPNQPKKKMSTAKKLAIGAGITGGVLAAGAGAIALSSYMVNKDKQYIANNAKLNSIISERTNKIHRENMESLSGLDDKTFAGLGAKRIVDLEKHKEVKRVQKYESSKLGNIMRKNIRPLESSQFNASRLTDNNNAYNVFGVHRDRNAYGQTSKIGNAAYAINAGYNRVKSKLSKY